jgi:hypothetical protein
MKVYKLEVIVIDLDEIGESQIKDVLENVRYPNHCISPEILSVEERDIGEWSDEHPLNKKETKYIELRRLFGNKNGK